jgi:hypothetical protein
MSELIARPIEVRKRCNQIVRDASTLEEADEEKFSAMLGHLGAAVKQKDDSSADVQVSRRIVQGFIFGDETKPFEPMSSKQFTPGQKIAIMKWVGSVYVEETGKWKTRSTFKAEANWILNVALYMYASTMQHQADDFYTPTFGKMLEMYLGKDTGDAFLAADYWLKLALELPGAVMTRIYPEPVEKKKEEPAVAVVEAYQGFEY